MISEAWDRADVRDLAVASRQLGRPLVGKVVAVARRCSHGQPQVLVTYPLLQTAEYGVADENPAEENPANETVTEENAAGRDAEKQNAAERDAANQDAAGQNVAKRDAAKGPDDAGPCCELTPQPTAGVRPRWAPFPTLFWLTCPYLRGAVATLESRGMIEDVRRRIREDAEFGREYEDANTRYASQRIGLLNAVDRARLQMDAEEGGPGAGVLRVIEESGIGGAADWAGVKCLHMNVADFMAGNANPVGGLCVQRLTEDGAGQGLECADGRCVPAAHP